MPDTPRLTKPSTSETCESRSSSRSGPRQMIDAELLAGAFGAGVDALPEPCVVPFGMTAIVSAGGSPAAAGLPPPPQRRHSEHET